MILFYFPSREMPFTVEKKKYLNIKQNFQLFSTHAVQIWDNLDEN